VVNGVQFLVPTNCEEATFLGLGLNIWGEFNVPVVGCGTQVITKPSIMHASAGTPGNASCAAQHIRAAAVCTHSGPAIMITQ